MNNVQEMYEEIAVKEEHMQKIKDIIKKLDTLKTEIEDIEFDEIARFDGLPDDVKETDEGKELDEFAGNLCYAFGNVEIAQRYLYDALGLEYGSKLDE